MAAAFKMMKHLVCDHGLKQKITGKYSNLFMDVEMIAFGPVISASSKFVDDTQYVIYEYIFQFWTIK